MQSSPQEVIEDLENMCVVRAPLLSPHHPQARMINRDSSTCSIGTERPCAYFQSASCSIAVSCCFCVRAGLLWLSTLEPPADGVSEGEFQATLKEELPSIRSTHPISFCMPRRLSHIFLFLHRVHRGMRAAELQPDHHVHRRRKRAQICFCPSVLPHSKRPFAYSRRQQQQPAAARPRRKRKRWWRRRRRRRKRGQPELSPGHRHRHGRDEPCRMGLLPVQPPGDPRHEQVSALQRPPRRERLHVRELRFGQPRRTLTLTLSHFAGRMVYKRSRTLSAISMRAARAPSRSRRRCTVRSIAIFFCIASIAHRCGPPDAHNVCTRAKNHYDPQAGQDLFTAASDTLSSAPSHATGGQGDDGSWVTQFQQTHEHMGSVMYYS